MGFKKRFVKKHGVKPTHMRGAKKNRRFNKELITYLAPSQMPFPPRYRTKFVTEFMGSNAAGNYAANARYFISLNSCYLPMNSGGWPNTLPAIATLAPTGYSSILNANLYQSARVYGSKVEIEFLPQALTDTLLVTLTPSQTSSNPASAAVAQQQPYTKKMFFSSSKTNGKNNKLVNYITQHKFLGVSKRAIEDDLSGNYIQAYDAEPVNRLFWVINVITPDVTVTVAPVEFRVKVTYYVECFGATTATLLET